MNFTQLGKILVAIAVILIFAAAGMFAIFFYRQDVSSNISDWGAFGSYLSGAIGAPISILALIGAVIAIHQQSKTDKRVLNHTVASDLVRSIERLEDNIDKELSGANINISLVNSGSEFETNALRVLMEASTSKEVLDQAIPKYNSDSAKLATIISNRNRSDIDKYNLIRLYEVCSGSVSKLLLMKDLLMKHKNLVRHNVLTIFYKNKYKRVVDRLIEAGYPLEHWDEIDQLDN